MTEQKDLIDVKVRNSYGDTFERIEENPTCEDLMNGMVQAAQQLGFSLIQIYFALDKQSEEIKQKILV